MMMLIRYSGWWLPQLPRQNWTMSMVTTTSYNHVSVNFYSKQISKYVYLSHTVSLQKYSPESESPGKNQSVVYYQKVRNAHCFSQRMGVHHPLPASLGYGPGSKSVFKVTCLVNLDKEGEMESTWSWCKVSCKHGIRTRLMGSHFIQRPHQQVVLYSMLILSRKLVSLRILFNGTSFEMGRWWLAVGYATYSQHDVLFIFSEKWIERAYVTH